MIDDIPCIILSGGKSSRMGRDKSFLPFANDNTLIEYQYKKLSKIFKKVYISSKTDKFSSIITDANIIYDKDQNISSPMVALESIFEKLNDEKVFIITVDVPLIEEATIKTIIKNSYNYNIAIAKDEDKVHNLCGVFSKSILQQVKELLIDDIHKINYLIKKTNNYNEILFNNKKQFTNLNTISDYKGLFT